MTFVVVGGGPTGVELAGQVAEIAQHTLPGEFRSHQAGRSPDLSDRIGGPAAGQLSVEAFGESGRGARRRPRQAAERGAWSRASRPKRVEYRQHDHIERLACRTVLWAAGVRASPLAEQLAQATGAKTDRSGRVMCQPAAFAPGP